MPFQPSSENAHERLRRSEAHLRRAQSVSHVGSWELALDNRTLWASDEAFRIYGLAVTPDNALSYDAIRSIPLPEYREALDQAMRELLGTGKPYELEFRIRRPVDGAIRDIYSVAEIVHGQAGRPQLIDGTLQDITERKDGERALRASEERSRMVLEQAADAIFIGNSTGEFLLVNDWACEITGYAREELIRNRMDLLFSAETLSQAPFRWDLLDRGEIVVNERLLRRKDGSGRLVEMRTKKLPDGTYQAIMRDLTERRRLEEQLQLRQRMDSIGSLAGGIAHDFNNILASIIGFADMLRLDDEPLTRNQLESVETILQSAHRASDLVRNLQSLSGSVRLAKRTFDLHKVAVELFNVLSETTNRLIRKDVDFPPGAFFIHGNESDIYHSLMNLGVNAIHAIEEKGIRAGDLVRICAEAYEATTEDPSGLPPGPYVRVRFSDTGNGMTPEVRKRVFEPLFTTKQKGERKGQGLGLAMVYNIITRQHCGSVQVESEPGNGTTFQLFLPRVGEQAFAPTTDGPPRLGHGETVLVVDDEPTILALTRQALERSGYQVLCASDGLEAVEIFNREQTRIATVLLDRTLPKLSGEAVFQRLRQLRPTVHIIVSSGEVTNVSAGFPGAFGTLSKPYTLTALREAVNTAITPPQIVPRDG